MNAMVLARIAFAAALASAPFVVAAQDAKKPKQPPGHPKVDQAKVDAAIRKGIAYLKAQSGEGGPVEWSVGSGELVLWTFVHADVSETEPEFQRLFKKMMEGPLTRTYHVSLQAMILEELDRVKYQGRIWQCAQFLVDNQCRNGMWDYGEPTTFPKDVPTGGRARKDTPTTGGKPKARAPAAPGPRPKPAVVARIPVAKKRDGPDTGDNSNSQYAALGLRACHDAGIVLPAEVIQKARKWWRDTLANGGWDYGGGSTPYGSMTAGGLGSLVIYHHILNEPWMKDAEVSKALGWLVSNYSVSDNPGLGRLHHLYYLYALERAGVLYGTETLGAHEWYPDGVKVLLAAQKADGSWETEGGVADTCFAILFLRRATRPLIDVASVDRFAPRK